REQHMTFAKACGNTNRISAFLTEASVSITHSVDELDAEALEVNVGNGTLFFQRLHEEGMSSSAMVELRPHKRRDLITKQMRAKFDSDARSPGFDKFLERVLPDREMREFLQRWFGLNLTSITGDQKLAFFYGQGANGKSVLTDLMAWLMGDYAATAKIESLTGEKRRGGGDATPDLVPLMGARMVRASEPEQGTRLQEGVIKELTGGEPMLVRALHSDFVEVKPQFKLTISGNHKPDIRNTDDGIWRRILLIPFDVQIPEAERDPDLGKKLRAEAPGILNWMVAGLIDYLEGGLQVPQAVQDATKEYREDSDPVGSFLAAACEVTGDGSDFTRSSTIAAAFTFWMSDSGESPWTPTTIQKRMKARAKSYRDPRTGQTFSPGKRSVAGYVGIKISDMFAARWKEVEPNAPVAPAYSSASPDPF
uniref:DNA primase family protein n=1 Tax=Palleronia sp. TaxID=1940284 RepID=UPI0035C7D143